MTEYEVKVLRNGREAVWPIRAESEKAAREHAELLLKRRGSKPQSKVLTVKEKKQ